MGGMELMSDARARAFPWLRLWPASVIILVSLATCQACSTTGVPNPRPRSAVSPSATNTPLPVAPPTSPTPTSTPVASGPFDQRCAAPQLQLSWVGPFSPATGQHTLGLRLTNTSNTGCYLFGYPGISLVDSSGRALPLQYLRTGDQEVTSSPPGHVDLPPGGTAYVAINKYRCDTSDLMHAVAVQVIPPDNYTAMQVSITDNVAMDYCGAGDPGSTVHVSPVEPTLAATIAHS
jgi:hypothetical protein